MRKLGLIGGMSWISTRTYYEQICKLVQKRHGTHASPPLLIESLDYRDFANLTDDAAWARATGLLIDSARRLEAAGAQAIAITANVMHRVYDDVRAEVSIPILHIADRTADKMQADGVTRATLLGTKPVMTEAFFRDRIEARGIELLPPKAGDVAALDRLITEELKLGKASREAERTLKTIITISEQEGAKAIVLACTELDLVVDVDANVLPIYDTARIHCRAAVDWICDGEC